MDRLKAAFNENRSELANRKATIFQRQISRLFADAVETGTAWLGYHITPTILTWPGTYGLPHFDSLQNSLHKKNFPCLGDCKPVLHP